MGAFGWGAVGGVLGIRLAYILAGILVGITANCLILPFRQNRATKQLCEKYVSTTKLLSRVCQEEEIDPQLYYSLVIQAHLQEDKLSQNAKDLNWDGAREVLQQCRHAVRLAHRKRAAALMEPAAN